MVKIRFRDRGGVGNWIVIGIFMLLVIYGLIALGQGWWPLHLMK